MFRQIIKLAIEAAKVEVDHWKNPTPAGALPEHVEEVHAVNEAVIVEGPVSVTKAVTTPIASWRTTSKGLSDALASKTCPDCEAPKPVHYYQCAACRPKKAAS